MSDIIRTTLGPRSMLKMILDANGGIVLTNDGHAILREIDVSHPAAKVRAWCVGTGVAPKRGALRVRLRARPLSTGFFVPRSP